MKSLKKTIKSVDSHIPTIDAVAGKLDDITKVAGDLPIMKNILETDLSTVVNMLQTLKVYATQDDVDKALLSYMDDGQHTIREATIVAYSIPHEIVRKLLLKNTNVTLFIQDEATAELMKCAQQVEWIKYSWDSLRRSLPRRLEEYRLTVYQYKTPATMAGFRLDDQLLCMSWYVYNYIDDGNRFIIPEKYINEDEVLLYGHNQAALIAQKDFQGFSMLKCTFDLLVDNYLNNARLVFPATSGEAQSKIALIK